MPFSLSSVEARILGCLLEKERTTPENYPLSLNALTNACNQSTARDPVVAYDEKTVERGLDDLREKKLATMVWTSGSRVQKFRHNLLDHYNLERPDIAVLCVLLLRGAQTPGELRARTDRLHSFENVGKVEECLQSLSIGTEPLIAMVPTRPGQKEKRYVQLLSPPPEESEEIAEPAATPASAEPSRVDRLEEEVGELKREVAELREELARFRRQFE